MTSYGLVAERTAGVGQLVVIAFSVYPISLKKMNHKYAFKKTKDLRVSMYVWMMMRMKGTRRLKNNQMSIIFK